MAVQTRQAVTFYHSVVCPRCQVTKVLLARALRNYPHIEVTKVELLTNRTRAREAGVKTIPSLVANGRVFSGVVLTQGQIERFFAELDADT